MEEDIMCERGLHGPNDGIEWEMKDIVQLQEEMEHHPNIERGLTPRLSITPEPRGHPSNAHRHTDSDETVANEIAHASPEKRVSFYLRAVEDMVTTVMQHESFLFSEIERLALDYFMKLDRESRYLFIRLYLRKPKWIRLDQTSMMDYVNSYGDLTDLDLAVERLCDPIEYQESPVLEQSENVLLADLEAKPERSKARKVGHSLMEAKSVDKLPLDLKGGLVKTDTMCTEKPGYPLCHRKSDFSCESAGEPGPRTALTMKRRKLSMESDQTRRTSYDTDGMIDLTVTTDEENSDDDIIISDYVCQTKSSEVFLPAWNQKETFSSSKGGRSVKMYTVEAISDSKEANEAKMDFSRLAYDQTVLAQRSTEEILSVLGRDELEELGRLLKVKPTHTNRAGWVKALIKTSTQSTLSFVKYSTTDSLNRYFCSDKEAKGKETKHSHSMHEKALGGEDKFHYVPFGVQYDDQGKKYSASGIVHSHAMKIIGPCIQLAPSFIALFDRLKLIYFRTGQISELVTDPLTTSLLVRFGKRRYPEYTVSRSFSIFPSLRLLREYEAALELEYKMEILLETSPPPMTTRKVKKSKRRMKDDIDDEDTWVAAALAADDPKMKIKVKAYQIEKKRILMEGVAIYDGVESRWHKACKEGAMEESTLSEAERRLLYYRMRFRPGWPLTRVVFKASQVFAKLGDHGREQRILRMLLAQKTFRRGLRGAWYDRLALILMNYASEEEEAEVSLAKKKELTRRRMEDARKICLDGLKDKYTHLIYHSSLKRRILKLERGKILLTPEEERLTFRDLIAKAEKRSIQGERLDDPTTGLHSIWKGERGDNVSVEELALEEYRRLGWEGFHSENSILTSLFALLFWDIIFASVDGVFETQYQSAPLDLATDAFYEVRRPLVKKRLLEIQKGQATAIISRTDDRERPWKTWCAGLNWARYTKDDFINVAEGIGGNGLAVVMTMFVEEYGHRRGGVPDLCLYNAAEKMTIFSEVKGPGDRLSETQKVWIDVLLRAGIRVEYCSVGAADETNEG